MINKTRTDCNADGRINISSANSLLMTNVNNDENSADGPDNNEIGNDNDDDDGKIKGNASP